MADDILSQFLVRIAYQQDDKSRKNFDEGLKQIQGRVDDFGKKIGELPTIIDSAMKKISASLSELYFNARKMDLLPAQLKAIEVSAEQSGEGGAKAAASFQFFADRLHQFGGGVQTQIQAFLGHKVNLDNIGEAATEAKEKIAAMYNSGDTAHADLFAKIFFGEKASDFAAVDFDKGKQAYAAQIKRQGAGWDAIVEKGKNARQAFQNLTAALETVGQKAEASLFDFYGATLNKIVTWIDDHQAAIIKFAQELIDQFVLAFNDLKQLFGPMLTEIAALLESAFAAIDKFLGNDDGGVKGLRMGLEALFSAAMIAGLARLGLGLAGALAPAIAFIGLIAGLGLLGAGADAIYHAFTDPDEIASRESAGSGSARRGRMGYRGTNKNIGAAPTSAQAKATEKESWDFWKAQGLSDAGAAAMVATEQGESGFDPRNIGDSGAAHGSFQWHMDRVNKILAATGVDVRTASHLEQLKAAKWEGEHGDAQARQGWQAVLHATSAAEATRAMTYLFERPLDKPGDTYTRQGYANRILREHGGNKTPIANLLAHLSKPGLDFHKAIETIKSAKPLAPWQQSMNEIHDHRRIENNVEVQVAGGSKVNATSNPLDRHRLANVVRNVRGSVA